MRELFGLVRTVKVGLFERTVRVVLFERTVRVSLFERTVWVGLFERTVRVVLFERTVWVVLTFEINPFSSSVSDNCLGWLVYLREPFGLS